jgi:hypothetical protein
MHNNSYMLYCMVSDAQAFSNAFYGQGSGLIYLDSVQCIGSELDLFDCPGDNTPSCTQADAAGVRCNPTGMIFTQLHVVLDLEYHGVFYLQPCVLRTQFSWLVGWTGMLVVLKCVSWRLGELCVIDHGHLRMPQLFADS